MSNWIASMGLPQGLPEMLAGQQQAWAGVANDRYVWRGGDAWAGVANGYNAVLNQQNAYGAAYQRPREMTAADLGLPVVPPSDAPYAFWLGKDGEAAAPRMWDMGA